MHYRLRHRLEFGQQRVPAAFLEEICITTKDRLPRHAAIITELLVADCFYHLFHHHPYIDRSMFKAIFSEYLTLKLREKNRYGQLVDVYYRLLAQEPESERSKIIKNLLDLPQGLSDHQRDELAFLLYKIDASHAFEVHQRFSAYGKEANLHGIEGLIEMLGQASENDNNYTNWLDVSIESVAKSRRERRFAVLDHLFKLRLERAADEKPVLFAAVEYFKHEAGVPFLAFYLKRLMQSDAMIEIDVDLVRRALAKDGLELAQYLSAQASAVVESDGKKAAAWFAEAAALYREGKRYTDEQHCLCQRALLVPVEETDLGQLRTLIYKIKDWKLWAGILERQTVLTTDAEYLRSLYEELGELNHKNLYNPKLALEYFEKAYAASGEGHDLLYNMISLAGILELNDKERLYGVRFLESVSEEGDLLQVLQVVKVLLKYPEGKDIVKEKIGGRIDRLIAKGDEETAGALGDVMLQHGLENESILKLAFSTAVTRNNYEAIKRDWRRLLGSLSSPQAVTAMTDWASKVLGDHTVDITFDQLIADTVHGNVLATIPAEIAYELKVQFAVVLAGFESQMDLAVKICHEIYSQYPQEERVWIPLYLLKHDYGTDEEIYAYLKEIYPKIAKKKAIFRNYTVTAESLRKEMERLDERFAPVTAQPHEEVTDVPAAVEVAAEMKMASGFSAAPAPASVEVPAPLPQTNLKLVGAMVEVEVEIETKVSALPAAAEREPKDVNVFADAKADAQLEKAKGSLNAGVAPDSGSVATYNWRLLVKEMHLEKGMTAKLLDRAFPSEVEKHVALQAVALLNSETHELNAWHWLVWRKPTEFGYQLNGRDRYPNEETLSVLQTPLHKLVMTLAPAFIKLYPNRFRKEYLAKKLQLTEEKLDKLVKPITWEDALFDGSLMKNYREVFAFQKFKPLNLPGLGSRIFYEGESRSIYFDAKYFDELPASVLFHRVYGLLWSVKLNYFVPLQLDPNVHVYPTLKLIRDAGGSKGANVMKNIFSLRRSPLNQALAVIDPQELTSAFARVEEFRDNDLSVLWSGMREHIYRLLIAETLDVIGVFESIAGRDLVNGKNYKPGEMLRRSPFFEGLLDFLTILRI